MNILLYCAPFFIVQKQSFLNDALKCYKFRICHVANFRGGVAVIEEHSL
jgi:hypothetical protein